MDPRVMRVATLAVALCGACGSSGETAPERAAAPATAAATPEPAAVAPTGADTKAAHGGAEALLAWLDPDAVSMAYLQLPEALDAEAFASVFAMPPKAARLLQDGLGLDAEIDAVVDAEAGPARSWFGPATLVMQPRIATGAYVLRTLTRPREQVIAALVAAKMRQEVVEGFTVLVPEGALPRKVAFLTDEVVAFIPAREIGSGLGPLTAGRDLPPSETRRELTRVLTEEPAAALELYASGPLLHFDLDRDVLQYAVRARSWQGRGLDVELRLLPDGDTAAALATLEHRDLALEPDATKALADRVGYVQDGDFVEGRLQIPAEDLAALGVRR